MKAKARTDETTAKAMLSYGAASPTERADKGLWLYLAAVINLLSRLVVGWSMQPHMQSSLLTDALQTAWFIRQPPPGLIFHSDQGSQYCGHEFQDTLKVNCWNDAPTESL